MLARLFSRFNTPQATRHNGATGAEVFLGSTAPCSSCNSGDIHDRYRITISTKQLAHVRFERPVPNLQSPPPLRCTPRIDTHSHTRHGSAPSLARRTPYTSQCPHRIRPHAQSHTDTHSAQTSSHTPRRDSIHLDQPNPVDIPRHDLIDSLLARRAGLKRSVAASSAPQLSRVRRVVAHLVTRHVHYRTPCTGSEPSVALAGSLRA